VLEEARVVRQIFNWVGQERCSIGEVCRRLKEQKVPSPKGKSYWDRTTVWGILKNTAYRGVAGFGKTQIGEIRKRLRVQRGRPEQPRRAYSVYDTPERVVPIPVPALVSEELFAAVGEQLAENRRRQRQRARGARYLLQGLLVCQQCGYAYYGKPVSRRAAKGATRHYAYYRCTGTDAYRFGGQRICQNKQVRTDLLEEAVWGDVCALLKEPGRVAAEYQRRMENKPSAKETKGRTESESLIQKVKRGIARLIDAYGEGLVDKEEFEPRIRQFKERLARLEAEAKQQAELEVQEQQLRLVIGQLQDFAQRVKEGMDTADWSTRRDIIRALVKRIEVGAEEVQVIYRVDLSPVADGPEGGRLPDCGRGARPHPC
jgi:site-specific DNA recombinase